MTPKTIDQEVSNPTKTSAPEAGSPAAKPPSRRWQAGAFLLGVLYPAATLCIELIFEFCANGPFNPIPTFTHVLMVALVPIANAVALSSLNNRKGSASTAAEWMLGRPVLPGMDHGIQQYPRSGARSARDYRASSSPR